MRVICRKDIPILGTFAVLCLVFLLFQPAIAADRDSGPERGVDMYFTYPEIIVPQGTSSMDVELTVENIGKRGETIFFDLGDVPEGWNARIKSYAFDITATRIPPGDQRLTTLTIEPDIGTAPGVYYVGVHARTKDGKYKLSEKLKITIKPKEEEKGTIEIVSSYPVLQGPSNVTFEFSISITNKTRQEQAFNLLADPPSDWQVNFKPPFKDRYVSSVIMKPDENTSLNVEVVPSRFAKAGEYVIPIKVVAGDIEKGTSLTVIITGTYNLKLGTPSGILSLEKERGKEANFTIFVRNTGSAAIRDIELTAMKPENWKVEFNPESLPSLEPGDIREVEMTIVSSEQALVGDYALGVTAKGDRASDDLQLRVTVKASSAWGWIGIAIILLVIVGLLTLFVTLGRR